ncbi:MAG: tRNA pseudouridine(38-40) synthase TruA [Candidatus Omnitrophica bacterium]|nr:tRNA pseudouridine(38-40) synthase TruA [Candidatus Omnitrophota bacterium]
MGKKTLKASRIISRKKSSVRNIKLTLEYDGSSFYGFQRQPHFPTVQETLEQALSKLFNSRMKIKAASGRTDAGVHAENQIVNFYTRSLLAAEKIQRGLNHYLPASVVVKKTEAVPLSFHARYDVRSKVYEYRIWNSIHRSPLSANQTWHIPVALDLKAMRSAAGYFVGTHDFRSFCVKTSLTFKKGSGDICQRGTVRTVRSVEITKREEMIRIRVEANGFLHHMVRNIVGTLVEVGQGKIGPKDVRGILLAKDRTRAGRNAPACGLRLLNVSY